MVTFNYFELSTLFDVDPHLFSRCIGSSVARSVLFPLQSSSLGGLKNAFYLFLFSCENVNCLSAIRFVRGLSTVMVKCVIAFMFITLLSSSSRMNDGI